MSFSKPGRGAVKEATRLVDICFKASLTMFDSADGYSAGMAEEILGQAIMGRRERCSFPPKAPSQSGDGPNEVGSSHYHLINAVEGSLRRLKTDYCDLLASCP
jgi:aryl-alcohol dehydrogenase-like predicted oxidoreductase